MDNQYVHLIETKYFGVKSFIWMIVVLNVADPTSHQDVATKNYVNRNVMTTIANLGDNFLRDGSSTIVGAIDMDDHLIKNASDLTLNQDVATKTYVDRNSFTTAGGVMLSDINMGVRSDKVRRQGCTDLTPGKGFILILGNFSILLEWTIAEPPKTIPVSLNTKAGFHIFASFTQPKYYVIKILT